MSRRHRPMIRVVGVTGSPSTRPLTMAAAEDSLQLLAERHVNPAPVVGGEHAGVPSPADCQVARTGFAGGGHRCIRGRWVT